MAEYSDNNNINSNEETNEEVEATRLAGFVYNKFDESERARRSDEERWLEAFHNYRGKYYKNVHFREHEKSRVFVKVTKTKVLAAYGQLVDVLFSANKFPISVEETKVPEGVAQFAHLNPLKEQMGDNLQQSAPTIEGNLNYQPGTSPQPEMSPIGFEGDGKTIEPGATFETIQPTGLEEGPAPLPDMPQIKPATEIARRMEKLIHDEIDESNGSQELRSALFESVLLGTGIIKGPFTFNKTLHKYDIGDDGSRVYNPEEAKVPRIEFVSAWDFYPDPNAKNIEECEYVIHRHKLNRNQLRDLLSRPFFNKDEVLATLDDGPNYRNRSYETQIRQEDDYTQNEYDRYEVLEYWGIVDRETLESSQLEIPEGMDEEMEFQINAWVTENRVLRMVLNPFKPYRIPYNSFPYEKIRIVFLVLAYQKI